MSRGDCCAGQHGALVAELDRRGFGVASGSACTLWKVLPSGRASDALKLAVFVGILAAVGQMARLGLLPRTRPIVPGELAVSD